MGVTNLCCVWSLHQSAAETKLESRFCMQEVFLWYHTVRTVTLKVVASLRCGMNGFPELRKLHVLLELRCSLKPVFLFCCLRINLLSL
jgi:hypothetical protein